MFLRKCEFFSRERTPQKRNTGELSDTNHNTMTTPSKPRPQSAYQLSHPTNSDTHEYDGDLELRRQQDLKNRLARNSKSGFDWAGKMGMEPTSLDKECDKCARILYTFTQRGTIQSTLEDPNASKKTQKVFKKIPTHIIQQAEGLAIFTVFRSGLGWSGASGSGIVIARDSPTTWGAPSGILIHTIGVGFLAGIDVYDTVLVLRTQKAVASFYKPKISLGAELAVVAGPIGNGVTFESGPELSPVFSYTKSKGIYGGLQLDGNIIIERTDENARFYGRKVKAEQILQGGAVAVPRAASGLIAVMDAAEGKAYDVEDLPGQIDIAPSEESMGVSTIHESRAKAAAEHGISEELDEETSNPASDDYINRRRTLPPLSFHQEASSSLHKTHDESVDLEPSSSVEPSKKLDEDDDDDPGFEPDKEREDQSEEEEGYGSHHEEDNQSVEEEAEPEPEPEQPVIPKSTSVVPPPPPRRRVPVPPPPTEQPSDTLPTQNLSSVAADSTASALPLAPSNDSVASLLDHSHDKPPEPFQLHERNASDASTAFSGI